MMFEPTRAAALERLAEFVPLAGRSYAAQRNYDRPGHDSVSRLSPYIRHRVLSEDEVIAAVLKRHSSSAAEKFIQEVYWRTYWKGWLEQRPSVWSSYRSGLSAALKRTQTESGLRMKWETACSGQTGIDCFDVWAKELRDTGYLHNHARMWFASIWIFTLRLPWELGADFFLRHLLDGDPASNTLGWRWVAGLQTVGKTYLARPDNIAKYTEGRFRPTGLAPWAAALEGPPHPERSAVPQPDPMPRGRVGVLHAEEDLSPGWLYEEIKPAEMAMLNSTAFRSPLIVSPMVEQFVEGCMGDLCDREGPITRLASAQDIDEWAVSKDLDAIVMSYPPVGPAADVLSKTTTPIYKCIRAFDLQAWPHAKAGFFKFKAQIPSLLKKYDAQLSLL